QFHAPHRNAAAQYNRHRGGGEWQRHAFGSVAAEIAAREFVWIAEPRRAAPKLDRALVIARERAIAPANTEARRNCIQRALVNMGEGCEALLRRCNLGALTAHFCVLLRTSQNVRNFQEVPRISIACR